MGVPVVAMAGRVPASRLGVAILSALGFPGLVAADRAGTRRTHRTESQTAAATPAPRPRTVPLTIDTAVRGAPVTETT